MEKSKYKDYISDFKNYLYAVKNLSELYVSNIIGTITQFLEFVNLYKFDNKFNSVENIELNDIRSITNNDIYSYIYYLVDNNYKPSSRGVKTEHLRVFFEFLYKIKNTIFKQPLQDIHTEKRLSMRLPNCLSLEESKRLIKAYNENPDQIKIRENAIINLAVNCGLRVSEISNLNISDFNFEEKQFLIHGKGKKERIGYLNNITLNAVKEYLEIRNKIIPKNTKDNDTLFITNKGTRINVRTIRRYVKSAYIDVGIDENEYSVHTLRHTCATLLYKYSGAEIHTIQELLRSFKCKCY